MITPKSLCGDSLRIVPLPDVKSMASPSLNNSEKFFNHNSYKTLFLISNEEKRNSVKFYATTEEFDVKSLV